MNRAGGQAVDHRRDRHPTLLKAEAGQADLDEPERPVMGEGQAVLDG
jgi:hypothetical protein